MQKQILENRNLFIGLVSSIWQRLPFIISCESIQKSLSLIGLFCDYVPDYRQLIVSGKVPKSIEFSKKKPRVLDGSDSAHFFENLCSCFDEERVGMRPIQFIYFDADKKTLIDVLLKLEQGWFATTSLSVEEIEGMIQVYDIINLDSCSIIFLKENQNFAIEEQLLEKVEERTYEIAPYIYQLKMSELNLIGDAILKEIEVGKNMTEAEIKELFDMEDSALQRLIYLLRNEAKMDISPYLISTPPEVQHQLNHIRTIDGIIVATALKDQKVVGMVKNKNVQFSTSILFPQIVETFKSTCDEFNFSDSSQLIIELKDSKKILLVKKQKYVYVLFVDTTKNIDILTQEITTMFEI
ncbi:hypothetical protein JW964_25115 [candidate division KSB1 bacterium]|nr:hypothetical protein [candidate division KSB1 bacterium]